MAKKKNPFRKLAELLKKNFFTGILVVIPLGVIGWICVSFMQWLWEFHELLPASWQPTRFLGRTDLAWFLNFLITLAATFLAVMIVSLLGWGSKHYLGKKILDIVEHLIERIPVIRGIYSALAQLLKTISSSGGSQQFSRVVYVEYPRKGCWTLAFVTGTSKIDGQDGPLLNVYVPTTPNPTSGFFLIVPEKDVKESHMKVEDAFKTILSLGIGSS